MSPSGKQGSILGGSEGQPAGHGEAVWERQDRTESSSGGTPLSHCQLSMVQYGA